MNKTWIALMAFVIGFLGLAGSSIVQAQATRTWVSGVGDDVNPCSRTAPCKTFAGAISKTAANGEISVLDPGGFGAVTITKSITIDGGGGAGFAGILNAATNGIIINAANINVTLRNLSIDGAGSGVTGIKILAADNVFIENSQIFGNVGAHPSGYGIFDQRTAAGQLFVDNTIVRNNAQSGIAIITSGPTIDAKLHRVQLIGNGNAGLLASIGSNVVITNSLLSGNTNFGLYVEAGGTPTNMFASDNTMSDNGTGLNVGPNSPFVRIANNVITANTVGVSPGGVSIISFGGNKISGNTSGNGPFSPSFTNVGTQ